MFTSQHVGPGIYFFGNLFTMPFKNFVIVVFSASENSVPDNFLQMDKNERAHFNL